MSLFLDSTRAALVVAHPSHELCIHGWLQQSRPYVCVLTDGGGRSGQSRLASTSEVLSRIGGVTGSIYGRLTDLQVYAAILNGDSELFVELVEELAQTFVDEQIDYVVGDAAEGYNVTHDICRVMIDGATELASRALGRNIASFDFPLVGPADERQEDGAIWLHLDDDAFRRKMDAARDYSQQLGEDVETALSGAPFNRKTSIRRSPS